MLLAEEKKPEILSYQKVDICDPNVLNTQPYRRRRSSIILELDNNSITPVDLQKLMETGMNAVKLKTSSMSEHERSKLLDKVDRAKKECSLKKNMFYWPIATCGTLKTCLLRTGLLEGEHTECFLTEGLEVCLTNDISFYNKCNDKIIFVDNSHLTEEIHVGMEIIIDDGALILHCMDVVDSKTIKCAIMKGGHLSSLLSVCVRGMKHSRPSMTKKDLQIIKFCLNHRMDIIIIYYVRHINTIKKTKAYLTAKHEKPIIFTAICTQEGMDNFNDILKESDGLLLAREFLANELDKSKFYRMPQIQKWMAAKCCQAGKPLLISGGILHNVIQKGILSDKDVSDVTNALMDGVTGFLLTQGQNNEHLINAINTLNDICCSVEPILCSRAEFRRQIDEVQLPLNAAEAAVVSCAEVALQTKSRLIVLPTVSGRTAQALLKLRPCCIVIAVSTDAKVARMLSVYRSVVPLVYKGSKRNSWLKSVQERIDFAIDYAVSSRWVEFGDMYVTLQRGTDTSSYCDTVQIMEVSVSYKKLVECPDDTNIPELTSYDTFTSGPQ